jgi:hypothetical protein
LRTLADKDVRDPTPTRDFHSCDFVDRFSAANQLSQTRRRPAFQSARDRLSADPNSLWKRAVLYFHQRE